MIPTSPSRSACARLLVFYAGLLVGGPLPPARAQDESPIARQTESDLRAGERLFQAHCARCHGMGGTGGEGPVLANATFRHVSDDASLHRVIQQGVEATTMPGNWMLSGAEIWLVAGYVRSLGHVESEKARGDAGRGRRLYEGKGACGVCHIIDGEGGSTGPDLSAVGGTRGIAYLRESLVDPSAHVAEEYLLVRATTNEGRVLSGARVNEDSFTLQLRDASGELRSLWKRDLRSLEKRFEESLMPSFATELSPDEIEDVVAYLASLTEGS